jgi:hypothetical protein
MSPDALRSAEQSERCRLPGQGIQQQVSAQFISRKLKSGGQGLLIIAPEFGRAVVMIPDPLAEQP